MGYSHESLLPTEWVTGVTYCTLLLCLRKNKVGTFLLHLHVEGKLL